MYPDPNLNYQFQQNVVEEKPNTCYVSTEQISDESDLVNFVINLHETNPAFFDDLLAHFNRDADNNFTEFHQHVHEVPTNQIEFIEKEHETDAQMHDVQLHDVRVYSNVQMEHNYFCQWKPFFECPLCRKRFSHINHLQVHIRTHRTNSTPPTMQGSSYRQSGHSKPFPHIQRRKTVLLPANNVYMSSAYSAAHSNSF